jgi:tRNA-splicing endonuclease subunit Sen15
MSAASANMTTLPTPSALTTLISQTSSDPVSALTTQVLHNLQHQHLWTSLDTHQLLRDPAAPKNAEENTPPTTLISGVPPHRVYTHPDEQLYLLELGLREHDLPPERMLVLPTTQGQSWTLRKMAAVFDSLPTLEQPDSSDGNGEETTEEEKEKKKAKLAKYFERKEQAIQSKEWGGKRLLFAMVDRLVGGDGTVVYYVFQEGIVKPRQN